MIPPPPVRLATAQVVSLLASGNLNELERLDRSGRMDAVEWKHRIDEYGRTLTTPPEGDIDTADVVPVSGKAGTWSVRYRLWTVEEGKSDLGVEFTVRYSGGDDLNIDLDDLRVA